MPGHWCEALSSINNELEYLEDSEEKVLTNNIAILEEGKLNILQAQRKNYMTKYMLIIIATPFAQKYF